MVRSLSSWFLYEYIVVVVSPPVRCGQPGFPQAGRALAKRTSLWAAPSFRCALKGDKFPELLCSVDNWRVMPFLSPCLSFSRFGNGPWGFSRRMHWPPAALGRFLPTAWDGRRTETVERGGHPAPATGHASVLEGAFGCSLMLLYINSSSSRGCLWRWTTGFFPMLAKACMSAKGVGARLLQARAGKNNLPAPSFFVDNRHFVPAVSPGLSTGFLKKGRQRPRRAERKGWGCPGRPRNAMRSAVAGNSGPGWAS